MYHHVNCAIALSIVETSPLTSESLLYTVQYHDEKMLFWFKMFSSQRAARRCEWAQRNHRKRQSNRRKEREVVI